MNKSLGLVVMAVLATLPASVWASGATQDFTGHWIGLVCIALFVFAYALVIGEEAIHLRKSKPMMVAAGIIWVLVAIAYGTHGDKTTAGAAISHNLLEFGELFLFLLAAMTYINTMDERGVFAALRAWLVSRNFSLRTIFWITGVIAFVLSPVADNLTTALLMSTVIMAVGGDNHKYVAVGCINIVVAANAGGAFSPFGDITTLMVWQKGILPFQAFFQLFAPSLVNWLIPAAILSFTLSKEQPPASTEIAVVKDGAWVIVGLFILTIIMAVSSHQFLHLPPVMGMMTGLGFLKFYAYYLQQKGETLDTDLAEDALGLNNDDPELAATDQPGQIDIFHSLARAEWDTLMFFYGIILCVGGLGTLGYLGLLSEFMYGDLGATTANIAVGFLSALIDNIPVMFAVLSMMPDMNEGQWLLVTLTAGVGGSMLSIGSAAGVAVMGQARGIYTFFAHLKWSWAIFLGYAASIWVHFLVNAGRFS